MKKKVIGLTLWAIVCIALIVVLIFGNLYAVSWDTALRMYFGEIGGGYEVSENATFLTGDELYEHEKQVNYEIISEGSVLLKNENKALPLSTGDKVSVFGISAYMWMTKEVVTNSKKTDFVDSLTDAGLVVNTDLVKMNMQSSHNKWGTGSNLGSGGTAGTWKIDEIPQSEYTAAAKNSYAQYNDVAIVVFSRSGGEGGDLPRAMGRFGGSDDESYLELNQDEKDLLLAVKAANFKKTVVILHTNNAMQMDFIDQKEYGIDACLFVGGTGENGVDVVGKILTGEINPSGRTVNSYSYDNFSSPVMQNFGDHRFTLNGALVSVSDYDNESPSGTFSYLNYGEGIYVDYKYYETRYEDTVLGASNVGSYDYSSVVTYPYGYGLSYTDFAWSDYRVSRPDSDGNITASVQVKNVGSVAGKDVVGFYYQSPYTEYDKKNLVEKSSVNMIEFGKTKLLQPGESDVIEVTFNYKDMKSYDANYAKTYIMDEGTYYITAAQNAHVAVNNILAAKGKTVKNTSAKMDADGNADMVKTYVQDKFTVLNTSEQTGATVTNQFDDVTLPDAVYLTRQNWTMMDNNGLSYATGTATGASVTTDVDGTVKTHEISRQMLDDILLEGWDASGNPVGRDDESWPEVQFREDIGLTEDEAIASGIKFEDMMGADYDDERWETLLSQMSYAETVQLVSNAGWGTIEIKAIGKGKTKSVDGPQGIVSNINTSAGYGFPPQAMTATTWNKEIAYDLGDAISQECVSLGISSWWAPAVNIYRSPFSGRNFEYCGVDGVFSGLIVSPIIEAAMNNGITTQMKHAVINDQEVNRFANGRLATFANEQCIRELYLKPFEIALQKTNVVSIMSTMTRVGTHLGAGSYRLNQNVLRGEFGLVGPIITDAQTYGPKAGEEILAGGSSMVLTTSPTQFDEATLNSKGARYMFRQAAKDVLYMYTKNVATSITITEGFPVYVLLLAVVDLFIVVYLCYGTGEILMKLYPEQTVLGKKGKWRMRIILWSLGGAALIAFLIAFFVEWLPMLIFAFQTM